MTVRQKQLILCSFELLPLSGVDGIWGKQSEAATRRLQQGLGIPADGVFGAVTRDAAFARLASGEPLEAPGDPVEPGGTFWDEIEFFTREEFRCQCGGRYCDGFPAEPEEQLVRTVDAIRRRLGVPVSIVDAGGSGVRCSRHNADVGGVDNSLHLYGKAADLHSAASPAQMKAAAEAVMGSTGGIGLYSWGIHVDTGPHSRWNG